MRLKRSHSATPSIDYPSGWRKDPQDDTDGLNFVCVRCGYEFFIHPRDYRGQFDHEPSQPVCPECSDE